MGPTNLLPLTWEVPQVFRDRLGDAVGRQRLMVHEDHLLLVLHKPPKDDETIRRGRFLWRRPSGEWQSTDMGPGPNALFKHLAEFQALFEKLDSLEEGAETSVAISGVIESLTPLKRTVHHLHDVLQEARKGFPDDRDLLNARDRAYDLERNVDLLLDAARNSLEFIIARRSEQQAQESHQMATSAHRLNSLVAFFFPMATLAAIMGTNLRHGLEDYQSPFMFLGMLAVGLAAGIMLRGFLR
jgi:Mg2+ and Co2+ transporter CorA